VQKKTSPSTNEALASTLLPAVQVRSVIEKLVRSGAIKGDKAEKWEERIKAGEEVKELQQQAEGGNALAMNELACRFGSGEGVKRDKTKERYWHLKAAQNGSLRALTNLAMCLDQKSNPDQMGMLYFMEAAAGGDAYACIKLAEKFVNGSPGVAADQALAKRWYTKALACKALPPDDEDKEAAEEWLSVNADVEATWKCIKWKS